MRPVIPLLACFSLVLSLPAHGQGVLFSDSFENGLTNWTATGLWNLQSTASPCGAQATPFPDGQFCAYYGIAGTCTYDTGPAANSGSLTLSTPVLVPANGPAASLRCWSIHVTEPCPDDFDRFDIDISLNGGASWIVEGSRCIAKHGPPLGEWLGRSVDLTPYLGQFVLVRFRFDTVDDFTNSFLGAFVDEVEIRQEAGTVFCADIQFANCPCGDSVNMPVIGYGNRSGCENSAGNLGELAGQGTPSVSNDSVVLNATEFLPHTVVALVQSEAVSSGARFGDGRLCLIGNTKRMGIHVAGASGTSFPGPGEPPLSIRGQVPPTGATRYYQAFYRDGADFCTPRSINLTNGYAVSWTP